MHRLVPVYATRRHGFSLVLSLTVMAMLLLLCITVAALLAVELRVARASVLHSRARLNALAASRIALGELQRLAGPDQRVTATAELLCNPTATDPTKTSYYESSLGTVTHPRWVGVWNSGRAEGTSEITDARADEKNRVLQRTSEGYLMDSRFVSGRDWAADRASNNPSRATPRLLGWLVSGAEGIAVGGPNAKSEAPTPYVAIDTAKDVELIGSGTFGTLFKSTNTTTDGLGLRARAVSITDSSDQRIGSYAYAVIDEGVKARVNLRDPYGDISPSVGSPGDGGYARLLIPQRHRFEAVVSETTTSGGRIPMPNLNFSGTGRDWDSLTGFSDISLAAKQTTEAAANLKASFFHDLTFVSAGIQADVVNGGLKKDLTAFLQTTGDIPDYSNVPGSGLAGASPLISESTLAPVSPKFDLLRNWWLSGGTEPLKFNASEVKPVAPTGFVRTYTMSPWAHGYNPVQGIPQNRTIPDLSTQTRGALSPVITDCRLFLLPQVEQLETTKGMYRLKIWVRAVLWNPYSVPLNLDGLTLDYPMGLYLHMFVSGSLANQGITYHRPWVRYTLPTGGSRILLQPGQSVMLVVDGTNAPQPMTSTDYNGIFGIRDSFAPIPALTAQRMSIPLKEGVPSIAPSANQFYVDHADGSQSGSNTATLPAGWPALTTPVKFSCAFGLNVGAGNPPSTKNFSLAPGWANFDETYYNVHQLMISDKDGVVYRQANLNPCFPSGFVDANGQGMWGCMGVFYRPIANQQVFLGEELDLKTSTASGLGPDRIPDMHFGFRMKFFDGTDNADTTAGGQRALEFAPLADMNPLSARITRFPFDTLSLLSVDHVYAGGVWTYPAQDTYWNEAWVPQGKSARQVMPFVNGANMSATGYPGALLLDVPAFEIGILSLGQFRHAGLNLLPYGSALSFGSSRIPIPAGVSSGGVLGETALTDRTGVTASERQAAWNKLLGTKAREQVRQTDRIGQATQDIYDIAFEQNHALWDSFWVSGIPRANPGWTGSAWQIPVSSATGTQRTSVMPNGRLSPVVDAIPSGGYFSQPNSALYRSAYSLLTQGAFNVNSTSVVAWRSLLAAFRGIKVPTRDTPGGIGASDATPYLRVLRPKSKDARGALITSEATWSGFRSLNDDELDLLAKKIVTEVKLRGPFLGLSDFVNRRLRNPSGDIGNWEQKEKDYLGTLEAAILAANLNGQYDATAKVDREKADPTTGQSGAATPIEPKFKSKHKVAGAPGYLEQGDLLQPLAPVLTARSDTFTVRAQGECDGVVATVELTVQRRTEPMPGPTSGDEVLPVNPKARPAATPAAGNQFFGRRMAVVSTRWLSRDEI